MNETRKARLSGVIQEELSVLIRGLKDPRVPNVTVTRVDVTDDGGQATIFLTLFGKMSEGGQAMKDCLAGLESASGFLRRGIAKVLTVKHIPTLIFKEDKGLANTTRVHELLNEIHAVDTAAGRTPTVAAASGPGSATAAATGNVALAVGPDATVEPTPGSVPAPGSALNAKSTPETAVGTTHPKT